MSRRRRLLAWTAGLIGLLSAALGVAGFAAPRSEAVHVPNPIAGRQLFVSGCSSCHGFDARGIVGRAPSLYGVGAQAADFYLRTGRMPLAHPTDEPVRTPSIYPLPERADLVAYIQSLGGPPVPAVHPNAGSLSEGQELFTNHCAGCHQVVAQAGIITPNNVAPSLQNDVTALDVAEAVRIGPYVMPAFSRREINQRQLDSIARYVLYTENSDNPGGWSLGNIGPIPEGMVTWLIALAALIVIARIIGERSPQ